MKTCTEEYYDKYAKEYFDRTVNMNLQQIYDHVLNYISPGSYILDAGCGSGRDSLYFISHGYKVTPIDSSKELVKLASNLINRPVYNMGFKEIDYFDEFDLIWANASLLHLNEDEIIPVMEKLTKSLKKNGIFYATFKHGTGCHIDDRGRSFYDYNEETIKSILNNNLDVLEIMVYDDLKFDKSPEKWIRIIARKKA